MKLRSAARQSALRVGLFRFLLLLLSLIAIVFGLRLSQAPSALEAFAGAFLVLSGAQIVLWLFGIRLEILSNTTNEIDPRMIAGTLETEPLSRKSVESKEDSGESLIERALSEFEQHMKRGMLGIEEDLKREVQNLEGRMYLLLGVAVGEASLDSVNPLKRYDENMLLKAMSLSQRSYEIFRDTGHKSEITALNNIVYYSCIINDVVRRDYLLDKARKLLKVGQEYLAADYIQTASFAILRFGESREEKARALEILRGLQVSPHATDRQKKEAALLVEYFQLSEEGKQAPNPTNAADA